MIFIAYLFKLLDITWIIPYKYNYNSKHFRNNCICMKIKSECNFMLMHNNNLLSQTIFKLNIHSFYCCLFSEKLELFILIQYDLWIILQKIYRVVQLDNELKYVIVCHIWTRLYCVVQFSSLSLWSNDRIRNIYI